MSVRTACSSTEVQHWLVFVHTITSPSIQHRHDTQLLLLFNQSDVIIIPLNNPVDWEKHRDTSALSASQWGPSFLCLLRAKRGVLCSAGTYKSAQLVTSSKCGLVVFVCHVCQHADVRCAYLLACALRDRLPSCRMM